MKKTLILLLVAWILSAATALGEGASSFSEEKTVFTESEFSVQLPQGWVIHEADREMQEAGVFFVASSPDGECTLQIAFSALDGVVAVSYTHLMSRWACMTAKCWRRTP